MTKKERFMSQLIALRMKGVHLTARYDEGDDQAFISIPEAEIYGTGKNVKAVNAFIAEFADPYPGKSR